MNENSENLKELFDGMYKLKSKLIQPRFDAEVAYTTKKGPIHGPFEFPNSGTNPQGLGSLTTYARRYSLSAAFGIAADKDDDGQTAAEKNSDTSKVDLISGKQLATLNDHIRQLSELSNSELDYVRNELSKELNVDVNENMPASMFKKAMEVLKQWIQQFQPQPEENITWGQN